MPNSGDTDGTDPLGPVGTTGSVAPSEGALAAEAATTEGASAVDGAAATGGPDSPQAIAQALASGHIDAQAARARLIEAAVRARMPPDAAPEAIAAVRAEVEALIGSDPVLTRMLGP